MGVEVKDRSPALPAIPTSTRTTLLLSVLPIEVSPLNFLLKKNFFKPPF